MASENVMYSNGNTNGTTARHGHGLSDVEKGNQGIGAAMSPQEEDRFERFAAAMAANNKLRDAQRVNSLRVADVGPLGLFAFGLTTALLQGATTKWTYDGTGEQVANTEQITYCYALFYGGLVQLLAGMWAIYRNNTFAGVAFSSYGAFWLGYGIFGILSAANVLDSTGDEGVQMMLALWCVFTGILWMQTLNINIALFFLFFGLTCTFGLLSAGVTHPKANKAGGYFGIFTAGCAFYTATAELTNEVYRKTLLPLGILNIRNALRRPSDQDRPDTL